MPPNMLGIYFVDRKLVDKVRRKWRNKTNSNRSSLLFVEDNNTDALSKDI